MIVQINHAGEYQRGRSKVDDDGVVHGGFPRRFIALPDCDNPILADQDAAVPDDGMTIIHRHEGAAQQQPATGVVRLRLRACCGQADDTEKKSERYRGSNRSAKVLDHFAAFVWDFDANCARNSM